MIRVDVPRQGNDGYYTWIFTNRKDGNVFDNKGQAINFLQECGIKDCEIRDFRFPEIIKKTTSLA